MRYRGRLIAMLIAFFFFTSSLIYSYLRTDEFDDLKLWGYPLFIGLAYICGKQYDRVVYYSVRDPLTGLFNRRHVAVAFRKMVTMHKFNKQCPYVIVMDCDNFKHINDTLGHDAGDHLLHIVAKVILQNIGKRDFGARWGGDEFLILGLTTGSGELNELLERIHRDIDVAFQEQHWENTSVSIGAALYSEEQISLEKLISIADKNMYLNKSKKKNTDGL